MSSAKPPVRVLITAEHASCRVPEAWNPLFSGHEKVLSTHRAWDAGTAELSAELAHTLQAPLLAGRVTRLLVDLNRSEKHPDCFSQYSAALPDPLREELLETYHRPHWQAYQKHIEQPGRWLHLACHSFTPVLDGHVRRTDLALLYDPARAHEATWCGRALSALRLAFPKLTIHANQPYRGVANGLGQQHRQHVPADKLLTAELEINTRLMDKENWPAFRQQLIKIMAEVLN